jgi:GT2 family glycosyltransferase
MLASLRRTTDFSRVHVVVVDNGSTDGTVPFLQAQEGIEVILNEANLGFVRGNNAALRAIPADHDAILLNNDTEIDDPAWVEKLQASAHADAAIGVVGCRIRQMDMPLLQHVGTFMPDFSYWGQQLCGGEADINQYPTDRDVEGVVFACVYIRREVLDKVGVLDEDYFSYYEDTDYCLKALAAGFRVVNCGVSRSRTASTDRRTRTRPTSTRCSSGHARSSSENGRSISRPATTSRSPGTPLSAGLSATP